MFLQSVVITNRISFSFSFNIKRGKRNWKFKSMSNKLCGLERNYYRREKSTRWAEFKSQPYMLLRKEMTSSFLLSAMGSVTISHKKLMKLRLNLSTIKMIVHVRTYVKVWCFENFLRTLIFFWEYLSLLFLPSQCGVYITPCHTVVLRVHILSWSVSPYSLYVVRNHWHPLSSVFPCGWYKITF